MSNSAATALPSMLAATGEEGLEQVGYRVLGPVDNATLALRHLEEEAPTLAVIDVLLKDGRCSALARELRSRRVPFLVHSGCRQDQRLTVDFQDTPWLPKPVWPHDIVATLDELSLVPVNG